MGHGKSKRFCHPKVFHIHQEKTRVLFEKSGILPCFEDPEELKT